jgi:hypothetical protein
LLLFYKYFFNTFPGDYDFDLNNLARNLPADRTRLYREIAHALPADRTHFYRQIAHALTGRTHTIHAVKLSNNVSPKVATALVLAKVSGLARSLDGRVLAQP